MAETTLPSERPSMAAERAVKRAARSILGPGRYRPVFEHGHWWVQVDRKDETLTYSVVDANNGFDFEQC